MENSDVHQCENMAEAAVETPAARFFCHSCFLEVNPILPDFTCPRCQTGFIEELAQAPDPSEESDEEAYLPFSQDGSDTNDEADALSQVADLWNMLNYMRRPEDSSHFPGGSQTQETGREGRYNASRPGPSRRPRFSRNPNRRQQDYDNARTRTEGFLHHLVTTLSENTGLVPNASFPVFLNLHSNPGDYAWGRGGWNAIITQLINQLDGTGPPPLPKEKIDEIPIVGISQEQVDKNLQCTVCMEDFKLDEPVRRLSCDHHFHNECIIPWLELHGTCPICRKLLNDGSSQDNAFQSTSQTSQNGPDVISLPGPSASQQASSNSLSDSDISRRSFNFNPLDSSIYDFNEEFD
ncbi:E3 ubiquitin-protein ligase RNF115 [Parasteatoda tepidariorum]|uniref:E3 ubiquitin-protein ligase RNF115 n=1 Tax=Parasteatoda tepidariorum TaxID=114398 RepID=UPI001C71F209|nr:E3 ubiquitin-protein ligase RNF115 [Parasteatoda tepidariorum]